MTFRIHINASPSFRDTLRNLGRAATRQMAQEAVRKVGEEIEREMGGGRRSDLSAFAQAQPPRDALFDLKHGTITVRDYRVVG